MKKILSLLLVLPLFFACDKDSDKRNVNPFLPEYSFSVSINTALPQYSGLNSPINPVYVDVEGAGVSGLIVMKISDTDYRAWEASCPNQFPESCSKMTIKNNTTAKCGCENFEYSLLTGVGGGSYTMRPYRYEIQGSVIRVYN
jgi:nitrite reductase/ring-hydroxylating ferredoxin subunit